MPAPVIDLPAPVTDDPTALDVEPALHLAEGRLQAEVEAAPTEGEVPGYRAWLVPEGTATDDGRYMMVGSLTPRLDRLPLMASDENMPAHLGATFVGNLVNVDRLPDASDIGWVTFEVDWDSDDDGIEWRRMVDDNRIRGVSADLIVVRARVKSTDPDTGDEVIVDYFTAAPAEDQSWPDDEAVWFVLDEGLVGGGTLVPMPAFRDARVEPIAAADALSALPAEWFNLPEFPTPQRAARDQYGRLRGHGAKWGTCLVGRHGCVIPPESKTGYALAKRLEGLVPIYWQTGGDLYAHAPLDQPWWDAIRWYEAQCKVVGLAAVGEDPHGIALAGYCGPELETRHLSGDWRPYPGGHELVGWSIVNKPGFPVPEAIAAAVAAGRAITGSAEPDCDCEAEAIAAAEAPEAAQTAPLEVEAVEGVLVPVESLERLTASLEGLVSQLSLGLSKAQLEWDRHLASQRVEQLTADLG